MSEECQKRTKTAQLLSAENWTPPHPINCPASARLSRDPLLSNATTGSALVCARAIANAARRGKKRGPEDEDEENRICRKWSASNIVGQLARKCVDLRTAGAGLRQGCKGEGTAAVRTGMSRFKQNRRVQENLCLDRHNRTSIPGFRRLQAAVVPG